ncbi:hypothetical protein J6590_088619 [Homalodisca vitripennis]|nr:hypothetical protein J6590_088619 [Homalodisca vitripennis]
MKKSMKQILEILSRHTSFGKHLTVMTDYVIVNEEINQTDIGDSLTQAMSLCMKKSIKQIFEILSRYTSYGINLTVLPGYVIILEILSRHTSFGKYLTVMTDYAIVHEEINESDIGDTLTLLIIRYTSDYVASQVTSLCMKPCSPVCQHPIISRICLHGPYLE